MEKGYQNVEFKKNEQLRNALATIMDNYEFAYINNYTTKSQYCDEISLIWKNFHGKSVSSFFDNHTVIKQVLLDFFDILIDVLQAVSILCF